MRLVLARRTLPIIATVGLLVGCGSVSAEYAAPLPDQYTIVPPAPDLPPGIAAFSGMWGGVMRTTRSGPEVMEHLLVVERVTAVNADVIWSLGATRRGIPSTWGRMTGRFVEGDLVLQFVTRFGEKRTARYHLNGIGSVTLWTGTEMCNDTMEFRARCFEALLLKVSDSTLPKAK